MKMETFPGLSSLYLGNEDKKLSCRCSQPKTLYEVTSGEGERAKKPIGKGVC